MPRTKHPYDPAAIAYAVGEVRKGRGLRDVANELNELDVKVSHMTVKRWVKEAAEQEGAPPRPPAPETEPAPAVPGLAERIAASRAKAAAEAPAADPDAPFDFEADLKRMIREAQAEARAHDAAANPRGAQAASRRASEMMKLLGQVEKAKPADPDVLQFSKAEIEKAAKQALGILQEHAARGGPRCVDCNRALSVKFGRGEA